MDRLLGIEGGQPLCTDDLVYMQQSAMEAIKGLVACVGMGSSNTILSGCERVEEYNSIRWNEGYIALKGEVYPVRAESLDLPNGYDELYWVVKRERYELREFENGSQNNVYERSEVVISTESAPEDISNFVSETESLYDDLISFARKYEEQNLNAKEADTILGGIDVLCAKYSNRSAFQILKVSVRGGQMAQSPNGYLFTYDPFVPDNVTSLVFLGTKMCILRLNGGNAYLYNTDGTPVTLLDDVGFNVNIII